MATSNPFVRCVPSAMIWLTEIEQRMGWRNKRRAYAALRAVLHALRDHLRVEEAAELAAQLPLLLRGVFYEGWRPSHTPLRERHLDQFLSHISRELRANAGDNVEEVTRVVLAVLASHVSAGEIDDIKASLPAQLRRLWEEVLVE